MTRRMFHGSGGSMMLQQQDGKERGSRNGLDRSNHSIEDGNIDRSIHSISEGTEEEEGVKQTADNSAPPIPPYRGDELANRRGQMDDSSHSTSSLGKQSNFIQQRINNHKKRGSWKDTSNDSDSSAESDDENQCVEEYTEDSEQIPRTPSMVCLLKMEPINEKEVLKNSWNSEEEVKSSFVSDVSGIGKGEAYEVGDMDAPDPSIDGDRQHSSFLPNIESERSVEVEITPMVEVKKVAQQDGDDDTFVFASINSADNITHASDAPDYDYNTKRGEQHNRAKNEERKPAAATAPYKQKFISPMERKGLSQERAQNKVRNEVCEVLGLPKDSPRKVHRCIMSRDTEDRLKDLIRGDPDNSQSSESMTVDSNDSSEDLVFGDSPERKSKKTDKWERVVHERRSSRRSITSNVPKKNERNHTNTDWTGARQAEDEESDLIRDNSWHNSFRWLKNLPFSVKESFSAKSSDDEGSLIGKIYNHFQHPNHEADDNVSTSDSTDSSESSSCSSSDEDESLADDMTWEMNIMTEGQYYLSMSMLVYVYGLLRQTSLLGHTEIPFDEIDVNSSQAESRKNKSRRYLSNTKSAGFIIRVVMDELEKKGAFSDVEKEDDMCMLGDFKQWIQDSRCNQLDSTTVDTIRELRRKVARKRWKRAIHAVRLAVRLGKGSSKKVNMKLIAQQSFRRNRRKSTDILRQSVSGSLQNLRNAGAMAAKRSRELASSMMWIHDQRAKIMDGIGLSGDKHNSLVDKSDVQDIVNDVFEQPRFFKEGSLMSNLIESSIEVVWFSDRHPNDVVYSICCNRRQKRVSVVFRGTVNSHNWLMNLKFYMTKHPNPIAEDYPGREEILGFHTGYSLYMARQRKDDSLTKIEEIFNLIDSVGRELAADGDYNLSITGHSLGGALATILSFYAATSPMFSKVKTIRVFTYAAPRVGCSGFAKAFQHLERKGKIRLARFSNTQDIIPLIPFHSMDRMGRSYKHVGMHIRLLGISRLSQYWLRQALDVTYAKDDGWLAQLQRAFWASLIMNLNTPAGYKKTHKLPDYLKRIRFTLEFRNALAQTDLLHDKKRARLKTLDEYYFIRGATGLTGTKELTAITIEESAKVAERRRTKRIVLGLLIVAIAEALLLLRFLNTSIECSSLPLILYPLYPLIGCQREVEVGNIHSRRKQATSVNVNAKEKSKSRSRLHSLRWPRMLSFGKRKAVSPTLSELPCYWGHCIVTSHSRLPWGVRLEHLSMPSDFEYQIGQVSQDLSLMSEKLVSDVHSFVIESEDIQSNISDTAFKILKAAEDNLQTVEVEHNESIQMAEINFFSIGLKFVVRLLVDFLESFIL